MQRPKRPTSSRISNQNLTGFRGVKRPAAGRTSLYKLTGFRGKTLWDWMQLLIIPIALAIGGFALNRLQSNREATRAEQRAQVDRDIATDNQREQTLQSYLDTMSELLLDGKLRTSPEGAEIRSVARIRTLSTLRRLDSNRKGTLLQFLHEARLISTTEQIIDLTTTDLTRADLTRTRLPAATLLKTDLTGAVLKGASLGGATLTGATLTMADLTDADFTGARITLEQLKAGRGQWIGTPAPPAEPQPAAQP